MESHGAMIGMLVAGIVLTTPPLVLGVAIGVVVLRRARAAKGGEAGD